MRNLIHLLLILTFGSLSLFSETIVFRSGKSLEGKITGQTSDSLTLLDKKGKTNSISKKKIFKILYNASEKERQKIEESAKALLEKEKVAKDAIAGEELNKLEEARLKELEALLEKNKVPVGETEESMVEYKRRIGDLESKVKEMDDFMGRQTDWRRYYEAPRSQWDLAKRSALLPGWGHIYAKEDTIGTAYTSLFFTSLALYLGSKEGIRSERNKLTSEAVDITLVQPILKQAVVALTPAANQDAVGNLMNFQAYDKINHFQKDSQSLGQLKHVSGNLEQITIALYLGQLVHSYITGRSWANLNRPKNTNDFDPITFQFKTIQEVPNPMFYSQNRPPRLEMGVSYQF